MNKKQKYHIFRYITRRLSVNFYLICKVAGYTAVRVTCSATNEVWSILEERIPRETIVYKIISQFRNLKPISFKKTPAFAVPFIGYVQISNMRVLRRCGLSDGKVFFSSIFKQLRVIRRAGYTLENMVMHPLHFFIQQHRHF